MARKDLNAGRNRQSGINSTSEKKIDWYTDIREIKDLRELLNGSCELYADRPAFWVKKFKGDDYRPIAYSLLKHDVDALGTKLIEMGLKGEKIAIIGQGSYEWFASYLAVVNGVGIVVPLDKEYEADAIDNLLERSGCSTILFTSEQKKKIKSLTHVKTDICMEFYGDRTQMDEKLTYNSEDDQLYWRQLVEEGESLLAAGRTDYVDAIIDPNVMSVLLFTSGTTGVPKGVMLSHWNIASDVMEIARLEYITPDDLTLSVLPVHHTYEGTGSLLFLYRGASIAYSEGLKYITKNMTEIRNTFFIAVPMLLEMIYDRIWKTAKKSGKEKMLLRAINVNHRLKALGIDASRQLFHSIHEQLGGRLRMVVSGAAALSPEIVRGFDDIGISIVHGYGLTETAPTIAATPSFSKLRYKKAGSTGMVVKNGELKIVDPDEDSIGEIWYKGPNVMLGYYEMPEETAEVVIDGWFNTGDLGFVDRDGWLYITGRKKNVVVTKTGENVYPEEIEFVVNKNPLISDCMVYALNRNNEDIVAIQILPNLDEITELKGQTLSDNEIYVLMKKIISDINEELPSYKRIRDITVRKEDFIRTTTRKIKRSSNI